MQRCLLRIMLSDRMWVVEADTMQYPRVPISSALQTRVSFLRYALGPHTEIPRNWRDSALVVPESWASTA